MEERENVYNKIVELLTKILGPGNYAEDVKYADIGMKSVNYTAMLTVLEDEFDVEIPYMQFKRYPTIGESVDFVCGEIDA